MIFTLATIVNLPIYLINLLKNKIGESLIMFKKILLTAVLSTIINLNLISADNAPVKATSSLLGRLNCRTRVASCKTRTGDFTTNCGQKLGMLHDHCKQHPEVTPITAAGLIVLGCVVSPLATIPFAAGLTIGAIGYKYATRPAEPKQD